MNVLKLFNKRDKYIKVLRKPEEFVESRVVSKERLISENIIERVLLNIKKTPEGVSWDEQDINVKRLIYACSLRWCQQFF